MSKPLVTIGLAVYNGENYLRDALEALVSQTYKNYEIYISDNASTDSTARICMEYAKRDPRIKYYRQPHNIGSIQNFNYVLNQATGTYFMWAAHDDLWAPTFIEKCVAKLEEDINAMMCVSGVRYLNADGSPMPYTITPEESMGLTLIQRLSKHLQFNTSWFFYGMYRREAIKKTRPLVETWAVDIIFMLEILFLGDITIVDEELMYYRIQPKDEAYFESIITVDKKKRETILGARWTHLYRDINKTIEHYCTDERIKLELQICIIDLLFYRDHHFRNALIQENNFYINCPNAIYQFLRLRILTDTPVEEIISQLA